MSQPAQKPGRSRQDYGTPADFLAAVTRRFGPIHVDIAATPQNAKAPRFITPEEDSLVNPRTGKPDAYPKDCMLSVFGADPGFDIWRWKDGGT